MSLVSLSDMIKKICSNCKKSGHIKDNDYRKSKGSLVASAFELDTYPVYNESLGKFNFTLKDNSTKDCNQYYTADGGKKIKSKCAELCETCNGWNYNSYEYKCDLRFAMGLLPKNTCALESLSNCAALESKSVRLWV